MEQFNKRLSELLRMRDFSQKELAERAGVTQAAMSHDLKGSRMPRASVLTRIAEALGTTTDYLLGGDETDKPKEEWCYAANLIARNVHQMSESEKMAIIRILMSHD